VFRRHAAGLLDTATDPWHRTISLDGKTLKQSFDSFNDRKAAQVLHAFNLEAGLVLAHIEIDEKSNEIPAAQRLLGELQLANCTVTLDAMHCQKKPSRLPQRRRRNIIVQLKDNQPTLLQQAKHSVPPPSRKQRYFGHKGRNRQETRTADVFSTARAMAETEWGSLIERFVRVTRDVLHRSAKTGLWSSTSRSPIMWPIPLHPRGSWQRYPRPLAHREHAALHPRCHFRGRSIPYPAQSGIFARLRSFAYNILQRNRTSTFSQERYAAALGGLDACSSCASVESVEQPWIG